MADSVNNPHDKFFKSLMNEIKIAKAILASLLSPQLLKLIDIDTLQHAKTSFVSDSLKETFSDVVFTVKLKNKVDVFITFLLEHKSYPDIFTPVQVLFYLASGYYLQSKNNKKLQIIIPLVFYHGKEKWEYKSLDELFEDVPENLKKYIPNYESIFIDLADMPDTQLESLEDALVSAVLMMQKYALRPEELLKKLQLIYSKMYSVDRERNYFEKIIVYSLQLVDKEKIKKVLNELPPVIKNKVMSAYEALIEEGYQKGIEKGIKKGIRKGYKKGKEEGEYEKSIKVILNGHKAGVPINILALLTNLPEEEVKRIIKEHGGGEDA